MKATMLVAVVLVLITRLVAIGRIDPATTPVMVTAFPPPSRTAMFPAPPTKIPLDTRPARMSSVSDAVTTTGHADGVICVDILQIKNTTGVVVFEISFVVIAYTIAQS